MRLAIRHLFLVPCVFAVGCGSESTDFEPTERYDAEIESPSGDTPAVSAIEVRASFATGKTIWVFACDANHHLRRNQGLAIGSWLGWEDLDSGCKTGTTPAVTKWQLNGHDVVMLFMHGTNDNIWEAYWPSTSAPNDFNWTNLTTAAAGFGKISGNPVVANVENTGSEDGNVSVAVKNPNGDLYTLDWYNAAWHVDRVTNLGSTPIRTANTINTRRENWAGTPYQAFISGRGLTGTDDTTSWTATRTGFAGAWTHIANLDTATDGTMANVGNDRGTTYQVAKIGTQLMDRYWDGTNGTAWSPTVTKGCIIKGSTRGPMSQEQDFQCFQTGSGYSRGGDTTDHDDDLMYFNYNGGCASVGGGLKSAGSVVEYASCGNYAGDVVYKGVNSMVYFYHRDNNTHYAVPGITLW